MTAVIPFPTPSLVEIEGRALEKAAHLMLALPALNEANAAIADAAADTGEQKRVAKSVAMVGFIGKTFDDLEANGSYLIKLCNDNAVSDAVIVSQCVLNRFRLYALAEVRALRLFVKDFAITQDDVLLPRLLFAA